MGYTVLNPTHPGSGLMLAKEDDIVIAEIVGLEGVATEREVAPLHKRMINYSLDQDAHTKGILIVNACKDSPLKEREAACTIETLEYCTRHAYLLVRTTQIVALYLDHQHGKLSFNDLHHLLLSSVGELEYGGADLFSSH